MFTSPLVFYSQICAVQGLMTDQPLYYAIIYFKAAHAALFYYFHCIPTEISQSPAVLPISFTAKISISEYRYSAVIFVQHPRYVI